MMPRVIDRAAEREVSVEWEDGHRSVYPARELRLACPCAGCVDEISGERLLLPEGVPAEVRVLAGALIGRYAVSFRFSDGHSTGIYTFERLRAACPCPECRS